MRGHAYGIDVLRTQALRTATWAFVGISTVVVLGLGVRYAIAANGHRDVRTQISHLEKALAEQRKILDSARQSDPARSADLSSIAKLQTEVHRLAMRASCVVAEFQAAPDVQPYLNRFVKQTPPNPWQQAEVQLTLKGRAEDIISVFSDFAALSIPVEFNAIELGRDTIDGRGQATVKARAQLRVLIRPSTPAAPPAPAGGPA